MVRGESLTQGFCLNHLLAVCVPGGFIANVVVEHVFCSSSTWTMAALLTDCLMHLAESVVASVAVLHFMRYLVFDTTL